MLASCAALGGGALPVGLIKGRMATTNLERGTERGSTCTGFTPFGSGAEAGGRGLGSTGGLGKILLSTLGYYVNKLIVEVVWEVVGCWGAGPGRGKAVFQVFQVS